jgi:ABC-type branched-subunit amino acid transport system permease subunit
MLLAFNNRMTSAEPISVAFSGELLAMVVIGGMHSFLGPALGALFFVIFRDSLSRITENWLLVFGLLFVAFVVFSPTGLIGLYARATARWRKPARRRRRHGATPGRHGHASGLPAPAARR